MTETKTPDDLLQPSLHGVVHRARAEGSRPWRLGSQFYVSFFGGPLAAAGVGYLNSRRLELPSGRRLAILATGLAAFAACVVAAATVGSESTSPRLVIAVAGVLTYAVSYRLQHAADRRYGLGRDDESTYDSLWQTGLVLVFGAGILSIVILGLVA